MSVVKHINEASFPTPLVELDPGNALQTFAQLDAKSLTATHIEVRPPQPEALYLNINTLIGKPDRPITEISLPADAPATLQSEWLKAFLPSASHVSIL